MDCDSIILSDRYDSDVNASDIEIWFRGTKVYEGNCPTITPPVVPAVTPPAPPPSACQSGDLGPNERMSVGAGIYYFFIPENRKALKIESGITNTNSEGTFTWIFPDGITKYTQNYSYGSNISLKIRSQSAPSPTIPDQYIPVGRHKMEITGIIGGFIGVEW